MPFQNNRRESELQVTIKDFDRREVVTYEQSDKDYKMMVLYYYWKDVKTKLLRNE